MARNDNLQKVVTFNVLCSKHSQHILFLGVLPLNLNLREFNVFVVTKLNKIFLGSSFASNVQQAKLNVVNNLNSQMILENLKKEKAEYSIIAELHDTQTILK